MNVIETDIADVQINSSGVTSYVNGYKIIDMLGEGTFSKVYLCQNEAGNEFALKVINKSILKRKREYKRVNGKLVLSNAFQKVQKEVAIMKKLAHSKLVKLYEVIDSPADDKLFLVLELIRGGQIMNWDDKNFRYFVRNSPTGVLNKELVRNCLRDVVAALDFLHCNHICHRDIKPENILLSGNQYKLADFGVAYMNDEESAVAVAATGESVLKLRSTEGTYHFLAPECTTGDEYDPYQVDVWALGVTMYVLLVGTLPFGTSVASLSDVMTSIREDPLVLPSELDSECAELLTQLLEKNPQLRITVSQLKTHKWVLGFNGELNTGYSSPVLVTQQEIEAAFTPVNNFILVMKLKMKMSTRLNKVRQSLANNLHKTRYVDIVPVTSHVPVSSIKEENDDFVALKTMEMAPSEQIMINQPQKRSSRLMESINDTVGSLSTTLTRRKSQLGAISPVFNSTITTSFPDSLYEEEIVGVLAQNLSKRNSETLSNEEHRNIISSAESEGDLSSFSVQNSRQSSLNGNSSRVKMPVEGETLVSHKLAKHKFRSTSFRGFIHNNDIPKVSTSNSPNKFLLSRQLSTSFRTLPLKIECGEVENINTASKTSHLSTENCNANDSPLNFSLQMNPSSGSPKHKIALEMDLQTSPTAKLPMLEILSVSSTASPKRPEAMRESEITPRRRVSNPTEINNPFMTGKAQNLDQFVKKEDPMAVICSSMQNIAQNANSLPDPSTDEKRVNTFSSKEEAKILRKKLHRNRSESGVDDSALMRKTSLARVLDACLIADRSIETTEVQLSPPTTPTRRYPVHVPPLPRSEELIAQTFSSQRKSIDLTPESNISNSSSKVCGLM